MKIGLMNDPALSVYDEITHFGEQGFDFIDLTIESPNALNPDVDRVSSLLDKYNLSLVGHTDPCLPYAYPIASVQKACLAELERCAKIFSSLGASVMNIHPCYACPPGMKKEIVKLNIQALKTIVDMTASYNLDLALENFASPFDSVTVYSLLFKAVPNLKLHLDVGHTNFGKDHATDFCRYFSDYLVHVHFSDNRGYADHHMPLGVGSTDWLRIVSALKAIDYNSTITLEVFCDNKSVLFPYLDVSRKLLLELWYEK